MNKLLFLLLLGSFAIQISAMDERPAKRQKHSEEPLDLSFFDELPDIADLEDINSENKENNENNQIMSNDLDQEPEPTLTDKYHQQCVKESMEYFSNVDRNQADLKLNILYQQLHDAIENDDEKAVKEALDKGANPNVYDEIRRPLLFKAIASYANKELISLLLSNFNIKFNEDFVFSPLHMAASDLREDIVELLIQHEFNVNFINHRYQTPLTTCIDGAKSTINEDIEDNEDFDLENYLKISKLLIDKGTNLNILDNEKRTALMLAVETESDPEYERFFKNSDLIPYLIEHGALLGIKNNAGETALDIAKRLDNKKIVELLEDKLAKNIKTFQKQLSKKILEFTPLLKELASLTSQYLEGEY